MSLENDIRNLPPSRKETPADAQAEQAGYEMRRRREAGLTIQEKEPGRSMFGDDGGGEASFSHYYGSGDLGDKKAARNEQNAGGTSFREVVESGAYKHTVRKVPHSRFGLPGAQMTKEYGATKGTEHIAFIEQMEAFREADSEERFNALWNGATEAQKTAYNKWIETQRG